MKGKPRTEVEEYDIDMIKLNVSIEKKDKKTSISKTLTIQLVEYTNYMEKINALIQKHFTMRTSSQQITAYHEYTWSFK